LCLACSAPTEEAPESKDVENPDVEVEEIDLLALVAEGVARLNEHRAFSGLTPVEDDAELAAGCLAHVRYMAANQKVVHEENTQNEWYTPEGKQAGVNGNIAGPVTDLAEAVDFWMASPYHRIPVLEPSLTTVGAALESGYACVDLHSALEEVNEHAPVPYPGDGQENVPMAFSSYGALSPAPPEYDEPTGFVISLTFPMSSLVTVDFSATLTNVTTGQSVESFVRLPFDPNDPYAEFQQNSVLLIPRLPLATDTKYEVRMSGVVDEEEVEKTWYFRTGDPLNPEENTP
jgi:hypothetical protein